jgi:thiosulfate dehydrogenase
MQLLKSNWWLLLVMFIVIIIAIVFIPGDFRNYNRDPGISKGFEWDPPDTNRIPSTPEGELIRYGKDLIANTALYLGPKGKIAAISNGMNCQNCHLDAGTRLWGNNYSAVFSTYPKFRSRSGNIETIYKRVNDCIERSLNGTGIDSNSREMQAIYAYIRWLGKNVPKNIKPDGAGIADISFPNRAADPARGKIVYFNNCKRCHATDGQGAFNADSTAYEYPPLWGINSYNTGAGIYRISKLAGYIRHNMPNDFGVRDDVIQLTDEEAWDVAAFIVSQPRPEKKFPNDWPDISSKPIDHPYGPYPDSFSEQQHKYGPFGPIAKSMKK